MGFVAFFVHTQNVTPQGGEMVQWLRSCSTLVEDQSLVPSIYVGQLTLAYSFSFVRPDADLHGYLHSHAHTWHSCLRACTHTLHIIRNEILKKQTKKTLPPVSWLGQIKDTDSCVRYCCHARSLDSDFPLEMVPPSLSEWL